MPQSPSSQPTANHANAPDRSVPPSPPPHAVSTPHSPTRSPSQPRVQFRPRKRSRKTRLKPPSKDPAPSDADSDQELTRSELHLMKQAQLLREQTQCTALDMCVSQPVPRPSDKPTSNGVAQGDDVIGGLKESFAVERSGVAIEERMGQYIEEGMKRKFGDLGYGGDGDSSATKKDESELYMVPERLQVSQRPMYDPGEGMPAAGVEEVEISAEGREKNVRETIRAHRELVAKGARREGEGRGMKGGGNVSANYVQHRRDLMGQHGKARGGRQAGGEEGGGAAGRRARGPKVASDGLAVERFRKRWRRK